MKIYVNEMPTKPKECLFARKEIAHVTIDINTGKRIEIPEYFCNVNMKKCNIDCGGKCNKLRIPDLQGE